MALSKMNKNIEKKWDELDAIQEEQDDFLEGKWCLEFNTKATKHQLVYDHRCWQIGSLAESLSVNYMHAIDDSFQASMDWMIVEITSTREQAEKLRKDLIESIKEQLEESYKEDNK